MTLQLTFKDYRVRSPILRCPTCKGRYIKTREGQRECLFCLRGRERREENRKYYEEPTLESLIY